MSAISEAIGRLRRAQPRNPDTMLVCDELEKRLISRPVNSETMLVGSAPVFSAPIKRKRGRPKKEQNEAKRT